MTVFMQLVMLLFVSRLFTLFTFIPKSGQAVSGSTALLTIYDMCKAVDKSMEMGNIYLEHKSGGKSGEFVNPRKQGI